VIAMSVSTEEGVETDACNEVVLRGKVSAEPEERVLPSGDSVWVFRVVVPRTVPRGRTSVDTLDCAVWSGRAKRSVGGLRAGDQVAVHGALRRRFFKAGGGTASRVEVEVSTLRVVRKAVTRRSASS
jgi:single-strand DNA-binding protein